MPPYVSRKRSRSASPLDDKHEQPPNKRKAIATSAKPKPQTRAKPESSKKSRKKKATLFEDADAKIDSDSFVDNKAYIANISDEEDEEEHSDSDEFEDVVIHQKHAKTKGHHGTHAQESDEDGMDWEEVHTTHHDSSTLSTKPPSVSGDLELTLNALPTHADRSLANGKKGPSKIERQLRVNTHCMHVQYLLFHNHIRNVWVNDAVVQKNVYSSLTPTMKKEVERWKSACGDLLGEEEAAAARAAKTKGKEKDKAGKAKSHRNQRDWGHKAEEIEQGTPNVSRGDPTIRLLKTLCAFWRKRFTVTAPGLRKQGYKDLRRLEEEVKAHRESPEDEEQFGERIASLKEFQDLARSCTGSRDIGAQLFTALLRASGMEARLVANIQPIGFGWSKGEEAKAKKEKGSEVVESEDSEDEEQEAEQEALKTKAETPPVDKKMKQSLQPISPRRNKKRGGTRGNPVDLDGDSSDLSEPPHSDEESVIEVASTIPHKVKKSNKRYDRDLPFPSYWTEVLSPISKTWIPLDPIIHNIVAHTPDTLSLFEPRGAQADRAKQVLAYTVGYSSDLTAKDITVRYLKKHVWPGKTKGVRMPAEKIAIYNKRGKVIRTELFDFFPAALRPYTRHPVKATPADRIEDSTDLMAIHIIRDTSKPAGTEDTLQSLKASADFVLERHLRREEALLPHAKPVRHFTSGKGDKEKTEPIYNRSDVVACKTIESWHKEGRAVREGEQPLKHVPMRAVTLMRKREIEEMERETGEKAKQALYSKQQTEWIIPPPIVNGVIPKNAFGNMDVYVDTMVPKGAVHLPYRGTARVCKKLGVDFAEACTGFEFGNKRAVPVLTGVVVAAENKNLVLDAWRAEEREKARKEKEKREKLALTWWRKMMRGLAIVERVKREYGDQAESHMAQELKKGGRDGGGGGGGPKAQSHKSAAGKHAKQTPAVDLTSEPDDTNTDLVPVFDPEHDNEGGGGFLREGHDVELLPDREHNNATDDEGGGFILEDERITSKEQTPAQTSLPRKPVSLQALHAATNGEPDDDDDDDGEMQDARDAGHDDADVVMTNGHDVDEGEAVKANSATKRKPRANGAASKTPKTKTAKASSTTAKRGRPKKSQAPENGDDNGKKGSRVSGRAAARRSSGRIKSHYFADSADEDDDEVEDEVDGDDE